ncbi:MAG: hypothetical protein R3F04_16770 [Lysobacteraceae bacterium]
MPVAVSGLSGAEAPVEAGNDHTCAVVAGGAVQCWGDNRGQLGDDTTIQRLEPMAVSGLVGVATIAGGEQHTCAVVAGGAVHCWGRNGSGELGDGSTTDRYAGGG